MVERTEWGEWRGLSKKDGAVIVWLTEDDIETYLTTFKQLMEACNIHNGLVGSVPEW